MKVVTWNIKGISDPKKARAIHSWLRRDNLKVNFICLQEIKATGSILQQRLQTVHQSLHWFSTNNPQGSGGAAIGVSPKLDIKEVVESALSSPNWIGVKIKGPIPFSVVSVYAGGSVNDRTEMWIELQQLEGPVILTGDFNMVESIKDR